MSPLEEAIAELGRQSWTGINIIGKNTDWCPVGDEGFENHIKSCPIWKLYEDLTHAASKVKSEWNKTSKKEKEMLFSASLTDKE